MDRYVAQNVEKGSSLILAQHGGSYFQTKFHFSSIYETEISDRYLSWGKIKKKNVYSVGVIKDISNSSKVSNKILLEVRMRKSAYQEEIKIDSGFLEGKKFSKKICVNFFHS